MNAREALSTIIWYEIPNLHRTIAAHFLDEAETLSAAIVDLEQIKKNAILHRNATINLRSTYQKMDQSDPAVRKEIQVLSDEIEHIEKIMGWYGNKEKLTQDMRLFGLE